MNVGVDMLSANLSMSVENIILLALTCGNIIFYALDFKLGNIFGLFYSGVSFVVFYNVGWNYVPALVLLFVYLIILSLTLITGAEAAKNPV
jgi:hypothetical protein